MPKPRRRLLLLLIPSSLAALALLHLVGGGLRFRSLSVLAPANPIRDAIPSSFSPSMLALKEEEAPLPEPRSHQQKLQLLEKSSHGSLQRNSSSAPSSENPRLEAMSLLRRLLRPGAPSRRFSIRADEFLNGSNSSCGVRFFMTWISKPQAAFGPRELLAVESLFNSHPAACLLILSDTLDSAGGTRLLKPFEEKGFRVAAMSPDVGFLLAGTPADDWFRRLREGGVDPGEISLGQNLSNLLRLAVLYKFGGVYIDTDVIVLRSFVGLKNAIGAQAVDAETGNWSRLNNAVLVFDWGHPLVREFIEEFGRTFDGSRWGHNGPYLVSRVAARVAVEFTVLPPAAFYPVDWTKIEGLFRGPRGRKHSKWVGAKLDGIRRESFALHLWNKQSRGMKVEEGSVLRRIMMDCCIFCNSSLSAL